MKKREREKNWQWKDPKGIWHDCSPDLNDELNTNNELREANLTCSTGKVYSAIINPVALDWLDTDSAHIYHDSIKKKDQEIDFEIDDPDFNENFIKTKSETEDIDRIPQPENNYFNEMTGDMISVLLNFLDKKENYRFFLTCSQYYQKYLPLLIKECEKLLEKKIMKLWTTDRYGSFALNRCSRLPHLGLRYALKFPKEDVQIMDACRYDHEFLLEFELLCLGNGLKKDNFKKRPPPVYNNPDSMMKLKRTDEISLILIGMTSEGKFQVYIDGTPFRNDDLEKTNECIKKFGLTLIFCIDRETEMPDRVELWTGSNYLGYVKPTGLTVFGIGNALEIFWNKIKFYVINPNTIFRY